MYDYLYLTMYCPLLLLSCVKVDLYSTDSYNGAHPRLKLRSMYAEDPDDCLIFQVRLALTKFCYLFTRLFVFYCLHC
jgi:hypothetical protein